VGDPSGRRIERQQADLQQVDDNVAVLTKNVESFFSHASEYAKRRLEDYGSPPSSFHSPTVLSNLNWHGNFTMLDFLRDVGKQVRVNTMLNRERYIPVDQLFLIYVPLLLFLVSEFD
jgi:tyrosyl-tRNA synthetase